MIKAKPHFVTFYRRNTAVEAIGCTLDTKKRQPQYARTPKIFEDSADPPPELPPHTLYVARCGDMFHVRLTVE